MTDNRHGRSLLARIRDKLAEPEPLPAAEPVTERAFVGEPVAEPGG